MKKITVALFVGALLMIAGAAMAFDIPTSVPKSGSDVVDTVGKMGSKMGIDKVLKDAKCAFKGDNTTELTCDVKDLSNKLAAIIQGSKEAKKWHVSINITADAGKAKKDAISSYDRGKAVRDQLQKGLAGITNKYWNYNVNTTDNKGKKLDLSANVD